MSSNMERVAAMPDASLYVNRDGRRADDCVDSHGGGNLTRSQDPVARAKRFQVSFPNKITKLWCFFNQHNLGAL